MDHRPQPPARPRTLRRQARLPRCLQGGQAPKQAEAWPTRFRSSSASLVDPDSIFDVQIKRIHEYKRQLLAVMHVIHDYLQIVDHGETPVVGAHLRFRRQGRARILGCQADHQADPQRRRRGEQRRARQGRHQSHVSARLPRLTRARSSFPAPMSASRFPPPAWKPPAPAT